MQMVENIQKLLNIFCDSSALYSA